MRIKDLLTDDDAVSPVIGVILMVAITVILAAVIAAFVLGLGDTNESAPNPTFNSDYTSDTNSVEIIVTGGDAFDAERVTVDGNQIQSGYATTLDSGVYFGENTRVSAGMRFTVQLDGSTPGANDDFDLQLTWQSDGGDTSATIFETSGPDAA